MNVDNFVKIKNAIEKASSFLNGELAKLYGHVSESVLEFERFGDIFVVYRISGSKTVKWAVIDGNTLDVSKPNSFLTISGNVEDFNDEAAVIRWDRSVK